MPVSAKPCHGDVTYAAIEAEGITPDDIDETWLDDMVKRLFVELKRQLSQVEKSKSIPGAKAASERAADARTLASLERTLERLAKLEQQRALMRETKVAAKHDEARLALERRLDQLLAAQRARPAAQEPDE